MCPTCGSSELRLRGISQGPGLEPGYAAIWIGCECGERFVLEFALTDHGVVVGVERD